MPELDKPAAPNKRSQPFPFRAGELVTVENGSIPWKIVWINEDEAHLMNAENQRAIKTLKQLYRYHGTRTVP